MFNFVIIIEKNDQKSENLYFSQISKIELVDK